MALGCCRRRHTIDAYDHIFEVIIPRVLEDFKKKSEDYGETFRELGVPGQFSDMYRKVGKIKRAVWDGKELHGEQPSELAGDIIAHCLIMIYLLEEEGRA